MWFFFFNTSLSIVEELHQAKDYNAFKLDLIRLLATESPISEQEFKDLSIDIVTEKVFKNCYKSYQNKSETIAQKAFPVIKDIYENQSAKYENIVIPFTDGLKTLQVVTNLKEAYDTEGENIANSIEKSVTLAIIDDIWKDHLREMDDLKQSVQNAVYEQKDPLLIYKFESFNLFKTLIEKVNKDIVSFLLKASLPTEPNARQEDSLKRDNTNLQMSRPEQTNHNTQNTNRQQATPQKLQPISVEKETGRNEKVTITNGSETKELKWKKAKPLIESGEWTRI